MKNKGVLQGHKYALGRLFVFIGGFMSYSQRVYEELKSKSASETEFLQAAEEILLTIDPVLEKHPEFEKLGLLERFIEPERIVIFRVPWADDSGQVHVNRGYRVQFNSAIGPYKGGLRFHPSVNLSILKFLGLEQVLKNALTTLAIGGAKGGSDFDSKGRTDSEVMRFCQSFMTELSRHIGADLDIPAGDIGVGPREIGYLYGQYKRLRNEFTGALTGKGVPFGGSLGRVEATGYGLLFFMEALFKHNSINVDGMNVVISGSGNVSMYANDMATKMGMKVVAMSDSDGYIYDPKGINFSTVQEIKEVKRLRISEYTKYSPSAEYYCGCKGIWNVKCDVALPCATQNEIDLNSAKKLISNGVIAVGEGANMPSTTEAINEFLMKGVLFAPGKAANAGGVATSALEMSQNSMRLFWTKEEVLKRLKEIMTGIHKSSKESALEYGYGYNLVAGANIAGFLKVAEAMKAQGLV